MCVYEAVCSDMRSRNYVGEESPANEVPAYSEFLYEIKPRSLSRRLVLAEFLQVQEHGLYRGDYGKPVIRVLPDIRLPDIIRPDMAICRISG